MLESVRARSLTGVGAAFNLKFLVALVATACAVVMLPASAGAFGIANFDVTPSTTTQSAHPNLSVSFDRTGPSNEDLRDASLAFPPGLTLNPTAVTKCSSSNYNADNCPSASNVGSINVRLRFAVGPYLFATNVSGSVYARSNTQLGLIVRPGIFPKARIAQTLTTGPGGQVASTEDIPRQAALFGFYNVNITVMSVDLDYRGFAGTSGSGPAFVTNPSTCTPATTTLTAVSYQNVTRTATDSFTPTGCGTTTPAPVVTITAPASGSVLGSADTSVAFTATNSPTSTTCKLDAAAAADCTSPQAYTGLTDGSHTVVVTASNAGGSGSATVTFKVDTTNPVVNITSPADGSSSSSTTATTNFTVSDATTTTTTCQLDAAAATACSTGQTYSGLSVGSHTITVTATDQAGNTGSASTTFEVTAPTPVPVVTITSPASGAFLNSTSTSVAFTATNSPTSTTCKLDAAAAAVCTSPQSYTGLSQGSHTVTVTATNAGGSGSASVVFTVDSVNPVVNITSPANGSTTGSSVTTNFTVTDATTTTKTCQLDAAAATACSSGQTYSGLSVGSHTIIVTATDQAGNTGSASTTFTAVGDPTVTITSPTAGAFLNSTTASVAFTATNSPTSITCKLDAAAAAACTSPQSYTGLAQGSHTVTVTATNASGSGSASVTFTVDSVNPVVNITSPANGSSSSSTTATTNFTVTDATTTTTTCKLDAAAAAACTTGQTYSGLSVGSHTITVVATDQAGNTGSASTTFTVTAPTPAPVVTITSPTAGAFLNSTTASVAFTATNSPTSITCKLDAAAAAACTSPQSYTGLSQGSHTVTVTATNASGSGSASVTFTVDSVNPVVNITAPANGSTTGTSVTTNFTVTDATTTTTTCKLDAAAATACSDGQVYSGLAPGSTHTIVVTATDQASNTGSASTTFTVGNVPSVTITSPAAGAFLNSTSASVAFTTTGSPTSITCKLDAAAAAACTSPQSYTGLAQGSHTVTVTATNASGSGSASVTFTVDSVNPVVNITAPANGSTTGPSVTTTFTVTDATTTTTTCKLDAAAATACTSGQAYSGLAPGSTHTIVVTATDQASNTGSASTTFTVGNVPTVTITSPAAGAFLSSTSASVAFTTTGSPTSVTCKLDAAAAAACTSPQSYTGLSQGSHTVTVTATNASGSGSGTVTFTVDTVNPVVNITSPANGSSSTSTTATTNFTVTDATTTTTTCKLDAAAAAACTTGQTYSGLSVGSHTITVTATDQAGNTGSASTTFDVTAPVPAPVVTITSPTAGAFLNSTTASVAFTATNSPTSITCKLDAAAAAACTSPQSYTGLSQGSHTVVVTATNASGSGSASVTFTVDSINPVVNISAPANGSTQSSTSATVNFTVTDATTTTTTCKLDAAAAAPCTSGQSYSGLSTGSHTITVVATDQASNTGSASTTFTVASVPAPTVTFTTVPGPATASQTPSYSFTTTGSPTSTTCSIDGGAASACSSPFTPASPLSDQAVHTVTVTVTNASGSASKSTSTWVDTRPYGVTATLQQLPNSITTAANVSAPLAHPNVRSVITLASAKDTKDATLILPHGLEGSLASIPDPSSDTASTHRRCSISEATAGTCPASSIIGQGSGTIVTTDSSTPITVTGTGYLTDPPSSSNAAGLAIKATVPGGRGDIIAKGAVDLVNNGATIQMMATNIPNTTTLGVPFHATSLDVTINGDTGATNTPSRPLITNPSYCFTPTPTTGTFGPFNASTNAVGYVGQFGSIIGNITATDNTTATTTVPYPVTGCSNTVAPFNPGITETLTSPTPGTSTAVAATVTMPTDNSATIRILSKQPAKLGPNTSAYGNATDMCPSSSAVPSGAVGVGNQPFDPSTCPAQARIGQVRIVSPLIDTSGTAGNKKGTGDGQIVGDVYLINKSPLPWLGIHIDPSITYPGRGVNADSVALKNPQGVSANLLATTATPTIHPTCSSGNGDTNCGIGQPNCDTDTQFCQTQISVTVPNIPDLPLSSTALYLGVLGDGTTPPPGRVGVGGITSNNPLNVITAGDNTCASGIDPNSSGADSGGGSPFSPNAVTQFTAWSRTNATGAALAGTTLVNVSQAISTPGC